MRPVTMLLLALALPLTSLAQGFGKNKVQYEDFNWRYIQSEHFDIYFTPGSERVAEFTAETAEEALKEIQQSWGYALEGRVTFITYGSHNYFQQTNVTTSMPEESVGGFTEFLKNRIVIPFTGNYEEYRHVIHHELTHAVNLRMFYGTGFQSILLGTATSNIPLWFTEGIAEYESREGWDVEADMFMRDATVSGYLPPIDYLGGYFAYKGGQAVFYYLDRKYGKEKVGEFVNKVRQTRDVERALESAIELELEDFDKDWQLWLRRIYWPSVAELENPPEFAERITDHNEWKNFVNNGPGISPNGSKIAFLSDRSDYFDIWIYDIESGHYKKLLRGERSAGFEQLKWLDARIGWSPDGKYITFASKAGRSDAVNILDVDRTAITRRLRFDLDGIFNPTWSPDGQKIAFVGLKDSQSDLYYVELESEKLVQVTDDIFSDDDPAWSPDSRSLLFTSDRRDSLRVRYYTSDFEMWQTDYSQTDVYRITIGSDTAERLTETETIERSPVYSPDGSYIIYSSDANGIFNLYRMDVSTGETYAITNVLTSCRQPSFSLNTERLVFTSLFDAGYDIYMLKSISDLPPIELKETNYRSMGSPDPTRVVVSETSDVNFEVEDNTLPFSNYIFAGTGGQEYGRDEGISDDTATTRRAGGGFFSKKYRVKFTPDYVYAAAAYSSFFGAQGSGQILFSDILGDQLILIDTDLYYDFNNLENSNFAVLYYYLPHRINYGAGVFRYVYYLDSGDVRDQTVQIQLNASYPFSKYTRLQLLLSGYAIDRAEWLDYPISRYQNTGRRRVFLPELAYVYDTVVWGSTGPVNGTRYRLSYAYSPPLQGDVQDREIWDSEFYTLKTDVRQYIKLGRDHTWAARLTAGISDGPDPQRFFLGGVSNWINRRFENNEIPTDDINDFYFSTFVTPFRGGDYFEDRGTGNRYFLTNQEFRFPMVRYLQLGWPLPLSLQDIRGALFTDIGAAWNDDKFEFSAVDDEGKRRLADVQVAYGLGIRSFLGFFVLRWDVAWTTDWIQTSRPLYYMSLGAEY